MSSRRRRSGTPAGTREGGGIQPRYRRAFGCVTWVNMGMLVFLAAAYLVPLPFRFFGDGTIPTAIPFRLTLFGLVAFLPGVLMGAYLGVRTYRIEHHRGTQIGAGIGAVLGWTSFFVVDWLGTFFLEGWASFFGLERFGALTFLMVGLPVLAATGLVLYGLYSRAPFERRKQLTLAGSGVAVLLGLGVLATNFDLLGAVAALMSAVCGAMGGWVGGSGYARAGGDDMIPPGAVIRRPEESPKSNGRG
ncbi:MAG: hypothetical protein H0V53_08560 [Rubrobacter sp.]|nr:hypothetical protein [Rubrobacter sp.]